MANLGNLFYSVYLKDLTDADRDKIRKKVERMTATVSVTADVSRVKSQVSAALSGSGMMVRVNVDKAAITKDINDAIKAASGTIGSSGLSADIKNLVSALTNATNAIGGYTKAIGNAGVGAGGVRNVTNEFKKQEGVLSNLYYTMRNVYSIVYLNGYLGKLIEVGGEFQKQRIALGSILGDTAKANELFSQMKDLAVESPFRFREIAVFAKQLSAFSIPYEELFETTKRLADISAGLGIDMGRIILAFGQVRSASVLRGQELRQFTEAGIPLVQKLAEKFTELEGAAVSAGDVFEKISNRQVSFQMVKDVLWDLTNEGGSFYDMQGVLADTLIGKLEKLRDSYEIMLGEIAEANRGLIGGALDEIRDWMKDWESLKTVLLGVIGAFAGYKATMAFATAVQTFQILKLKGLSVAYDMHAMSVVRSMVATGRMNASTVALITTISSLKRVLSSTSGIYGIILAVVGSFAGAMYSAYENASRLANELQRIGSDKLLDFRNEADEFGILVRNLGDAVKGTNEYQGILEQIQTKYGSYLGNLKNEADAYEYLKGKIDDVTTALRNKAMADAEMDAYSKIKNTYGTKLADSTKDAIDSIMEDFGVSKSIATDVFSVIKSDIDKGLADALNGSKDEALEYIKSVFKSLGDEFGKIKSHTVFTGTYNDVRVYDRVAAADAIDDLLSVRYYVNKMNGEFEDAKSLYKAMIGASDEYAIAVRRVDEALEERMKHVMANDAEEKKRLKRESLFKKRDIYARAGQQNLVKQMEVEIALLDKVDDMWVKIAKDMLKVYGGNLPQESDSAFEYIERLQKRYGELKEQMDVYKRGGMFGVDFDNAKKEADAIKSVLEAYGQPLEKKSGGGSKDSYLDDLKRRLDILKRGYKELVDLSKQMGMDAAISKINQSGFFGDLFAGGFGGVEDYRKKLDDMLNELLGKESTGDRRSVVVQIKELLFELDKDDAKRGIERLKTDIERQMDDMSKRWDVFKQLVGAGMGRSEAASYSLVPESGLKSESEYLRKYLQDMFKDAAGNVIGFGLSESDAEKMMGGKDGPLYNAMFESWKRAKKAIEDDDLKIKIDEAALLSKYYSIQQKIDRLNEKYALVLPGFSVGDNGMLSGDDGLLSSVGKAYLQEYIEEFTKLKSEAFSLLPVYQQLFGDMTYKSYGQMKMAQSVAEEIRKNAVVRKDNNGKPQSFTSFYTDLDGGKVDLSGTYGDLERLIKLVSELDVKLRGKNPFAKLSDDLKDLFSKKGDGGEGDGERIRKITDDASECAKVIGEVAGSAKDMFDALGDDALADAMGNVEMAMQSVSNIADGFKNGGVFGGIAAGASAAFKWIGALAQAHDKKLDKAIKKSELRVKELSNAYDNLKKSMDRAYSLSTADAQKSLNSLWKQRLELVQQIADEEAKHKTDQGKISDLRKQIADLTDQIDNFYEDLASDNYGASLKEWSATISDALVSAFSNGENAAEAFDRSVNDIMRDMVKNMVNVSVMQPAISELRNKLFGNDGIFGPSSENGIELSVDEGVKLAEYLKKYGDSVGKAQYVFDKVNAGLEQAGVNIADQSESGLSAGVKGVTENTADLLSSYINGIRADVSVNRESMRRLIDESIPQMSVVSEAQLQQLSIIAQNTARNVEFVADIRDLLKKNVSGANRFNV